MEEKNKFAFNFIEMAESRIPVIKENYRNNIVFFGDDNNYPQYLESLYYKSNKMAAMLSTIGNMITGNGFIETPTLESFIENPNNKETLQEILPKIALDLTIFGAYSLNVIWSRDGKSIAQIKYVSVKKVRFEMNENEEESEIEYFQISNNWLNIRKKENKPIRIQGFSTKDKSEKSQLLYVKKYSPGLEFYGLPFWLPAVLWAELDYEVANYHLQSVLNGYFPGLLINMSTGIPTPDEQKELKKKFDAQFQGTNNANKTILTFSDGKDTGPEVIPLTLAANDEKFEKLEAQILQNILIAMKLPSPQLAGVETSGKLGTSKDELATAFEIYQTSVIGPMQDVILTSLQKLVDINGINENLDIEEYQIFKEINNQTNVITE